MDPVEVDHLKREWTDQRVTVRTGVATLRRFDGRVGTVLTVNMNGRALVRFDGLADIGWYDLPIDDLVPAAVPAPPEENAPPPPGEPPITSATRPKIEAIPGEPPLSPPAERQKPLSILELARRQGAAKPKS